MAETQEQTVQAEDPMGYTVRNSSPSLNALGRGGTAFPGIKEQAGSIELPRSLANKQGSLLKTANLDAGFLQHFT